MKALVEWKLDESQSLLYLEIINPFPAAYVI